VKVSSAEVGNLLLNRTTVAHRRSRQCPNPQNHQRCTKGPKPHHNIICMRPQRSFWPTCDTPPAQVPPRTLSTHACCLMLPPAAPTHAALPGPPTGSQEGRVSNHVKHRCRLGRTPGGCPSKVGSMVACSSSSSRRRAPQAGDRWLLKYHTSAKCAIARTLRGQSRITGSSRSQPGVLEGCRARHGAAASASAQSWCTRQFERQSTAEHQGQQQPSTSSGQLGPQSCHLLLLMCQVSWVFPVLVSAWHRVLPCTEEPARPGVLAVHFQCRKLSPWLHHCSNLLLEQQLPRWAGLLPGAWPGSSGLAPLHSAHSPTASQYGPSHTAGIHHRTTTHHTQHLIEQHPAK